MDNAADIIQTALDIIISQDREVELVILDEGDGGDRVARIRWATLVGLESAGPVAHVIVENYRYSDGEVIAERTLVGVNEIISIARL